MKRDIKCPACSAELEVDSAPSFRDLTAYGFKAGCIAMLCFGLFFWVAVGLLAVGDRIGPVAFKVWQSLGGL
jgi:hypothetical protein